MSAEPAPEVEAGTHARRRRPITIAHFIVNLFTSSPAVIFPALQLAGVVPT
ncbi:hypothetical protein [Arthrobacter sp. AOP36-C1-22]|uniref:hypothetical protein n=1 Tax=Arthrobacter sp. AOP36-C1-22 TaxID=3457683 RepID=UPI0040342C6F